MANTCKTVKVTVKGDIEKVLDEVKKAAKAKDVVVSGDTKKGTLKHTKVDVKGTYEVDGQDISVSMTEDTWLASCDEIEQGIKDWFKGK